MRRAEESKNRKKQCSSSQSLAQEARHAEDPGKRICKNRTGSRLRKRDPARRADHKRRTGTTGGHAEQSRKRQTGRTGRKEKVCISPHFQRGCLMSAAEYRKIIAVDFDGTLAVTQFPTIIEPKWNEIAICKALKKQG